MTIKLTGKTAVITGAARGLGLCIAEELAKEGVNICGTDLRREQLEKEFSRISEEYDVQTLALEANVTRETEVRTAVADVYRHWNKIDILVNNAGIRIVGPVHETSIETWNDIHDVNLRGQFLFTREVLGQGMLEQNEGSIIFLSSDAGLHGNKNSGAYCASKWGVIGLAETVAKETKHTRIRVTTIAPGRIWTPMAEESEYADAGLDWLDPGDVARAIVFCISQKEDTIIPMLSIYPRSQI